MKFLLAMLSLLVLLLGAQCSRQPAAPQNSILGRYALAGYDNSGQLIFTGEISLESLAQDRLKGQCVVTRSKNAPAFLSDSSGDCAGIMRDAKNWNWISRPKWLMAVAFCVRASLMEVAVYEGSA